MSEPNGGEVVRYTTKELLAEIREGITVVKTTLLAHDQRLTALEKQIAEHDEVRLEYVPKVDALLRNMDIQGQVKAALDSRWSRWHKIALGFLGLVVISLQIMTLGPDLF